MSTSRSGARAGRAFAVLACALAVAGCGRAAPHHPNVLWVVWDTARAADMSLYGYDRPTTPHLEIWAKRARVFEDAVSAATTTLPSHASMFTGMAPLQHGVDDGHARLAARHRTLAEIFSDAGYRTYLFSANPYVGRTTALAQGFDRVEHPWSDDYAERAARIVAGKTRPYGPSDGTRSGPPDWAKHVKTAGALAQTALARWLAESDADRPFLAVLNYMEAHLPLVPDRQFRELFLTPAQVEASYREPLVGAAVWRYTAGLEDVDAERLAVLRGTYDAALAELDHLFWALLEDLGARGQLTDTIVVLTSDHGELLGEHHMLNHQYSIHEPLLRVPLVIAHPTLVEPGRDAQPAMNYDLFPTLLALSGVAPGVESEAVSLLADRAGRARLSEYPFASRSHIGLLQLAHPDLDAEPFLRSLRALRRGRLKYVSRSDGSRSLYDLAADPGETRDIAAARPDDVAALDGELQRTLERLGAGAAPGEVVEFSDETREMLESLGY